LKKYSVGETHKAHRGSLFTHRRIIKAGKKI
jgi:hypothetical protein